MRLRRRQPALRPPRRAGDRGAAGGARHRLFPPGEVILRMASGGKPCTSSSRARSRCGKSEALNAVLGPKDSFDSRALMQGVAGEDFTAAEETLCYLIPAEVIRALVARNPAFAAFFYSEVSAQARRLRPRPTGPKASRACSAPGCGRRSRGPAITVDGATMPGEGRPPHARGQHQRPVRARRRPPGVVTGMNLGQGGGAAAPAAGNAGPRGLSLRRRPRWRAVPSSSRPCC